MDDLSASFSRLGPLVKRFPKSQTVRFHLGLLLAWTGQGTLAVKEFKAAQRAWRDDGAREGSKCLPRPSRKQWDQEFKKMSRAAYASVRWRCDRSASD